MTLEGDWYVFKNFSADGKEVKFVADANWTDDRGGSFYDANYLIEVAQSGVNMIVKAGTYDVYLKADGTQACFMTDGKKPTEATMPTYI